MATLGIVAHANGGDATTWPTPSSGFYFGFDSMNGPAILDDAGTLTYLGTTVGFIVATVIAAAQDSADIDFSDLGGGTFTATIKPGADIYTQLAAHVADATAAHAASAISYAGSTGLSSTDVEAALDELDTEKQPIDSDLTTIAGLTPTTDNFMQAKASAWASRTPTQVTADLIAATTTTKGLQSVADYLRDRSEFDAGADFGVVFDLISVFDGAMTTGGGSTTLTCATSAPFVSTDVGKRVTVAGAGASGAQLTTTIATFVSSSIVTLTVGCSTTVTNAGTQFGTDNTTANALMVTTINALAFPTPKITLGRGYNVNGTTGAVVNTTASGAWGVPALMVFNKAVWFEGQGGGHTADSGDYTKIGGTRIAWWGTSSDGGTDFGAMITVSPTGVQSLKRPRFSACWFDGRNGDQNQACYLLKLSSCHGAQLDSGVFFMDALIQGLWTDIATSPTEAKDTTRFRFGEMCFRQLDNPAGATTTTTTTSTAVLLTNATPQTLTIASTTGYKTGGGYAYVQTTSGRRFAIKYAAVSGSTLTNCIVSTEDVIHAPTTYANAMLAPANPGLGGGMKLSGGSGANTCCGKIDVVQLSYGTSWGLPAIDCGNSDSLDIQMLMMNGGDPTVEANGNRKRRSGVLLAGSTVSNTLASRNMSFRRVDPGGSPSGPLGCVEVLGVTNTGALLTAPSGPHYIDLQDMGNGSPIPVSELGTVLSWTGNGMWRVGQIGATSTANQVLTAATGNIVTGTAVVVPPQGWQVGTVLNWKIPVGKTAVGTSISVGIRQHSSLTVGGGTLVATCTFTGTAVADGGDIDITLVCTALGTGSSGGALSQFVVSHALAATGLATGAVTAGTVDVTPGTAGKTRIRGVATGFNTSAPASGPTFLFVEINPVTASTVLTCYAPVIAFCVNSGNP